MEYKKSEECKVLANQIRKDIIEMTFSLGNVGAHLGGSLSMADILAVMYGSVVHYDARNPQWEARDRVILSKGHAALALYPAMANSGIIDRALLKTFKEDGSLLSGHPSLNGLPGIEFASGSLGQGLSLGVGVSLALEKKNNKCSRVYVLLGDGECDEGSIWEAAASASHYQLKRLVAIVDANKIQYDGNTDEVLNMSPLRGKWEGFGWTVLEVDGHNVEDLLRAFSYESEKPLAIIAHTIKGKGISFMEGEKSYHNARLTKEQYELSMQELEGNI